MILENLQADAGPFSLGPLSLELPAGAYGVIVGPSGAGKSTLLSAIAGLSGARGRVILDGKDVAGLPPEERRIALVPQGGLLFPHLDVEANVAFGVPRAERQHRVAEALAAVGAGHLAGRSPRSLSGGETMRVALARALATRPRLLLLDEPLSSLDPAAREPILELLAGLPVDVPVLHVTHDFEEAFRLADWLGVLLRGTLAAAGAPATLFSRPPSAEVASFLRIDNVLAGSFTPRGEASTFRTGALELVVPGLLEGQGVVSFDGASVLLSTAPRGTLPRNVIPVTVLELEERSWGLLVRLDAAGVPLAARLTRATAEELALAPGASLTALLKATAIHPVPLAR